MTTLFVKANDRPAKKSISVKMYEQFLNRYRESNPEEEIQEVHLYDTPLPLIGTSLIDNSNQAALGLNLSQDNLSAAAIQQQHLEQFIVADKIVIAFPLWNLTIPAALHMYLDCLHHPRKTFTYTKDGVKGLLTDKKAVLLNARGGIYHKDDLSEMSVRFVRNHLNFFGITEITECIIEGHHQYPDDSEKIIKQGLQQVNRTAETF